MMGLIDTPHIGIAVRVALIDSAHIERLVRAARIDQSVHRVRVDRPGIDRPVRA